jgi:hypothetical protein
MDEWMDGWMEGWMYGRICGQTEEHIDGRRTDGWMDKLICRKVQR